MKSGSILIFGLLLAHVSTAQGTSGLVAKQSDAVATIAAYDGDGRLQGVGTAFIVEDGSIVTGAHVVREAKYIGSTFSAASDGEISGIRHIDEELDLALLTASSTIRRKGLVISGREPEIGSDIVVIGSPMGLTNNVTRGVVSDFRREGSVELLQISAAVSSGADGSPVLNADGEVIGIVTSQFGGETDVYFAVSAKHLREILGSGRRASDSEHRSTTYSVVVASETTKSSARDVALSYRSKGYETRVVPVTLADAVRYRVCLGNYDDRESAQSDRDRLAGGDLPSDAWVVELP